MRLRYLGRKVAQLFMTLLGIVTFDFLLFRVLPGDPIRLYARSGHLTPEAAGRLRALRAGQVPLAPVPDLPGGSDPRSPGVLAHLPAPGRLHRRRTAREHDRAAWRGDRADRRDRCRVRRDGGGAPRVAVRHVDRRQLARPLELAHVLDRTPAGVPLGRVAPGLPDLGDLDAGCRLRLTAGGPARRRETSGPAHHHVGARRHRSVRPHHAQHARRRPHRGLHHDRESQGRVAARGRVEARSSQRAAPHRDRLGAVHQLWSSAERSRSRRCSPGRGWESSRTNPSCVATIRSWRRAS